MTTLTRRTFTSRALTAAAASALPFSRAFADPADKMTAAEVIAAIKQHLNMPWDSKTYRDTVKAGDPNTPVNGICSCFMDTFGVIKKAHAQGLNFVITHEPTFWTDADLIEPIQNDPLYLEKRRFIESNNMVVFRIHDHWHRYKPEPMSTGTASLLQWQPDPKEARIFHFPPTKLRAVAEHVATHLYTRSVRLVGDPNLTVTSLAQGGHPLGANIAAFDKADVVMASEVREWESVEYARDLIASGARKGFIVISHEAGEEEGMKIFAKWLEDVTPNIRTVFISTDDRMYFA